MIRLKRKTVVENRKSCVSDTNKKECIDAWILKHSQIFLIYLSKVMLGGDKFASFYEIWVTQKARL